MRQRLTRLRHRLARAHHEPERGSITVFAVAGLLIVLTLVGLVVDFGGRAHLVQETRSVAAEAARAGAQQLDRGTAQGGGGIGTNPGAAVEAANAYLSNAGVSGTVNVEGETVTVTIMDSYETRYLSMIGFSRFAVTGTGEAQMVHVQGGDG